MTESIVDIRDRLRPRLALVRDVPEAPVDQEVIVEPQVPVEPAPEPEPAPVTNNAFAVESAETGRILITLPAERETAAVTAEDFLLRLSGRLVEAERANGNGAFWSHGDLEFGLPSIAYGPLNWLHQERKVVGVLTNASMVTRDMAAAGINPHVRADSVMWKWLYPNEAREVAAAADSRQLWYSMECISRQVQCVGDNGCGTMVDYRERAGSNTCTHMRERSAHRRLVDPIFQGAAIIVPPIKPGWASADLEVTRQAANLVEREQMQLPGLDTAAAERMVAQVLAYANS